MASTQKDNGYVYIRVQWENVAPVKTSRTETVQHHVSQIAGTRNAAPVLQSVPVQLPAPTSQQWLGDSITISTARILVLQLGGSGDTSVDTVGTEPHLEALTEHLAGRIAVPCASAVVEVNVPMDSCWGITAISEELMEALQLLPVMMKTALSGDVVG